MSSVITHTHTHTALITGHTQDCREERGRDGDGQKDGGHEKERDREDGEERRHYVPIMLLSAA